MEQVWVIGSESYQSAGVFESRSPGARKPPSNSGWSGGQSVFLGLGIANCQDSELPANQSIYGIIRKVLFVAGRQCLACELYQVTLRTVTGNVPYL